MPQLGVEAFVANIERLGVRLSATRLADGTLRKVVVGSSLLREQRSCMKFSRNLRVPVVGKPAMRVK